MEAFGAGTNTAGPGSRGATVNRLGVFQRDETGCRRRKTWSSWAGV